MQEKSPIKQKILQYLSHKGISTYEFYKNAGVTRGILTQNNGISEDNLARFLAYACDINPLWLFSGEGEMLKQEQNGSQALVKPNENTSASHYRTGKLDQYTPGAIPLVSTQAVGGFFGSDFSIEESDIKSYYVIPKFRNLNVDFMIELTGDSMTPQICAGDIIACSIIRSSKFIQWNKTHLLATTDQGLIVKRLNQSSNPDCLLAVSNNPSYPPFDIPKDEVLGIARVVGIIHLE